MSVQSVTNDREGTTTSIPIGVGEGSHIQKAIVDKNARIGKNVMVLNTTCVSTHISHKIIKHFFFIYCRKVSEHDYQEQSRSTIRHTYVNIFTLLCSFKHTG